MMPTSLIGREALTSYLAGVLDGPVEVLALRPLGDKDAAVDDPKGFGYGVPFEVECTSGGRVRSLVVSRTRPVQGFGHDYPADRAWQALFGHTAYNSFPRHARSVDVGFVRASGQLGSMADATEFFQLVEKVEGTLYWRDLDRLLETPVDEPTSPAPKRWPASWPRPIASSARSRRSTSGGSASWSATASA